MTDAQFNIIKKLLKGDLPEYRTPATEGEMREIEHEGWYYMVYTKEDNRRNPVVQIEQNGWTWCAPLVDGLHDFDKVVYITPEQCAEWDDEEREQMKFADRD